MTPRHPSAQPPIAAIGRAARWCATRTGWRRLLLCALLGALTAGALPPLHLLILLPIGFSGLLWVLDGARRPGEAFLVGWGFGFGFFAAGLYWIGIAMTVDIVRFGWFIPVSVGGLSTGLSLFVGLVTWVVWRVGWRGPARVLLLAAAWVAGEALRGLLLTGFPWNLIGTAWSFSALPIQAAALIGVWGLSAATVLSAATPALLGEAVPRRHAAAALALAVTMVAGLWAVGAWRLAGAPADGLAYVPDVRLRLVQPSIPQKDKWIPELRRGHVVRQLGLSAGPGVEEISHVIWAETAVPFFLNREAPLRAALARALPGIGGLLVGAPAVDEVAGQRRVYNSLFALDGDGTIASRYDKFHLVPFGEYVPLRSLLGMAKLTAGRSDFTPGPGLTTVALPGLPPFSPLICYEVIFSGRVRGAGAAPQWLLNVTNDAWFGISSGPYQHFASARLRAVEEGVPLVRVANNGISAIVDPYGRVLARLGLGQIGVIDHRLPAALDGPPPYARIGRWVAPLVLLVLLAAAWPLRRIGRIGDGS